MTQTKTGPDGTRSPIRAPDVGAPSEGHDEKQFQPPPSPDSGRPSTTGAQKYARCRCRLYKRSIQRRSRRIPKTPNSTTHPSPRWYTENASFLCVIGLSSKPGCWFETNAFHSPCLHACCLFKRQLPLQTPAFFIFSRGRSRKNHPLRRALTKTNGKAKFRRMCFSTELEVDDGSRRIRNVWIMQ